MQLQEQPAGEAGAAAPRPVDCGRGQHEGQQAEVPHKVLRGDNLVEGDEGEGLHEEAERQVPGVPHAQGVGVQVDI